MTDHDATPLIAACDQVLEYYESSGEPDSAVARQIRSRRQELAGELEPEGHAHEATAATTGG